MFFITATSVRTTPTICIANACSISSSLSPEPINVIHGGERCGSSSLQATWLLTSFARALDLLSKRMATRFLWSVFNRPIKFKVPPRRLDSTTSPHRRRSEWIPRETGHVAQGPQRRQEDPARPRLEWEIQPVPQDGCPAARPWFRHHGGGPARAREVPRGSTNLPESADVIGGSLALTAPSTPRSATPSGCPPRSMR